jgi:hypothetical protein
MFKNIFISKKEKSPEKLGQLLYQVIQMGLSHDKLSAQALLESLSLTEDDVIESYQTEVIIALMFQVILVVEKEYDYPIAGDILGGMTKEFL